MSAGSAARDQLDGDLVESLLARVVAAAGQTTDVVAPATGLPLATVPVSEPSDVHDAVSRARAAQRSWARRSVAERTAVVSRFGRLLLDRRADVLDVVQLETGKARLHAFEEVADVAGQARHLRAKAGSYLRARRVLGAIPVLTSVTVHHRPRGVVGIISPWNFPFCLPVGDALFALVAGNGVVLKPDTRTALSTLLGVALLEEAGLPAGLVQVVVGDGALGAELVDAVDAVSFTGSTRTGRAVAVRAAERLVPAVLELGGKNALYVTEDVDVEAAAEGAVRASFTGAGQVCVSIERVYVHEAVAKAFTEAFVRRTRAIALGGGLDYTSEMGSLTTPEQLETVMTHVSDAIARGARVLAGGVHRADLGPLFFEPTIVADLPGDAQAAQEETFGPLVSVHVVQDDAEAVARMNDSAYGLNASVWTRSARRGRELAARIEAGLVNVNEGFAAGWATAGAPAGGWKDSGLGSRHGRAGLLAWTRPQSVAVQRVAHRGRTIPTPAAGLGRLYDLGGDAVADTFTVALRTFRALRLP